MVLRTVYLKNHPNDKKFLNRKCKQFGQQSFIFSIKSYFRSAKLIIKLLFWFPSNRFISFCFYINKKKLSTKWFRLAELCNIFHFSPWPRFGSEFEQWKDIADQSKVHWARH